MKFTPALFTAVPPKSMMSYPGMERRTLIIDGFSRVSP
jgi:hypothetical protein